jgi:hypothetical protein
LTLSGLLLFVFFNTPGAHNMSDLHTLSGGYAEQEARNDKYEDDENKVGPHLGASHPVDPYPPVDQLGYSDEEEPQNGVLQMEAITAVWSKRSLTVVYILCVRGCIPARPYMGNTD